MTRTMDSGLAVELGEFRNSTETSFVDFGSNLQAGITACSGNDQYPSAVSFCSLIKVADPGNET